VALHPAVAQNATAVNAAYVRPCFNIDLILGLIVVSGY
jgi:hypothetical protein